MKAVRFLFLFICVFTQGIAQEPLTLNLTQKDGLPSNTVYDIYQDDKGHIWFATDKGVSLYNGLSFRNFTISDGLPSNICFYFREDKEGRIWVGTHNGGLTFYKDDKWHNASNTPFLKFTAELGQIRSIRIEQDGSITFNFSDKNFFAALRNDTLTVFDLNKCQYLKEHGLSLDYRFNSVRYVDAAHYKLVYDSMELTIDHSLNVIECFRHKVFIPWIYILGRSKEYYCDSNDVYSTEFHPILKLPHDFHKSNAINRLFEYKDTQFLCTNHGIILGYKVLFKDQSVTTILADKSGYYWFSTNGSGVYILSRHFRSTRMISECYSSKVNFAYSNGNILLFCTTNGNIYRLRNEKVECLNDYGYRFGVLPKSESVGQFVLNGSYFSFRHQNFLKLGNISSAKPELYTRSIPDPPNINAAFYTDHNIILHGSSVICVFENTTPLTFERDWKQSTWREFKLKSKETIYQFHSGSQDRNRHLWLSTLQGIYKLYKDSSYYQPQIGNYRFSNFLFLDRYLIGITLKNQLIICNNYEQQNLYIDSSIVSDCVWDKLYRVNDSTLLISTNDHYRTLILRPSANRPRYTLKVLENQFVPQLAEYFYSDDTTAYFFKDQSVFSLPVKDMLHNDPVPENHFTLVKTRSRTTPVKGPVELSYAESRNITIQYSTVSLYADKLVYEYMLSPDKQAAENWQAASPGSINLVNIGYGSYTLKIRVKTYGGSYSKIQAMQFSIGKPYWLQWWFLVSLAVFICIIVLVFVHLILKRKAVEKEKEIRFLKSEFTALNALMNPHFVFNSLNSVQSLINKDEKKAANEYIRIISDLIRQNMYNIASDLVSLDKEMTLVENYLKLEKLRFSDIMDYAVHVDASLDMEMIMVPPLLIQPLVENAIKYGVWQSNKTNGFVEVKVYPDGDSTYIDVTDNGPGFATNKVNEEQHQSTAIQNIHKRLEHLSMIHNMHFMLSIEELKDEQGNIKGVRSRVHIA